MPIVINWQENAWIGTIVCHECEYTMTVLFSAATMDLKSKAGLYINSWMTGDGC